VKYLAAEGCEDKGVWSGTGKDIVDNGDEARGVNAYYAKRKTKTLAIDHSSDRGASIMSRGASDVMVS
jgi:hypothetical protein